MNSDHLGTWNVAPRAHPNDGKLDVISVGRGMTFRQRLQARTRLELGTHVPHPAIGSRVPDDHLPPLGLLVPETGTEFD